MMRWRPRTRRGRRIAVALAGLSVLAVGLAGLVLQRLSEFELSGHHLTEHRFAAAGARIEGTLALPVGRPAGAVAVLVHGDGPQTRWSEGGYLPLVNALLDAGIGVFSWDKPGTGSSTGDWLDQSMRDRAAEAAAAIAHLRGLPDLPPDRIGFLGFSQAGWAVPEASGASGAAFTILVGPAVNWRDQGAYYTMRRLRSQGVPEDQIAELVRKNLARNDAMFGAPDGAARSRPGMDPARLAFARRNYRADATAALAGFEGPMLAIWGGADLNVDPARNAAIFARTLPSGAGSETVILPGASHGLLRARWFNHQVPGDWPRTAEALFLALGRRAFVPGAVPLITGWIRASAR